MKLAEIARTLKNEGILSPSQYRYFNIGDKEKFDKAKDWYYVQVKDILRISSMLVTLYTVSREES